MHTYKHANLQETYIHTYIHMYIHTYPHAHGCAAAAAADDDRPNYSDPLLALLPLPGGHV